MDRGILTLIFFKFDFTWSTFFSFFIVCPFWLLYFKKLLNIMIQILWYQISVKFQLVNFNGANIFSFDIEVILNDSGGLWKCNGFISWTLTGKVICNWLEIACHLRLSFLRLLNHKVYLVFVARIRSESVIHCLLYFLVVLLFFLLVSHCIYFFLVLLYVTWHFLLVFYLGFVLARCFYYWMIIVMFTVVS